jgi:hypothetical protein
MAPRKATAAAGIDVASDAIRTATTALNSFRQQLDEIRKQIAAQHVEHDRIKHMPADAVTAEKRVDDWVAAEKKHGSSHHSIVHKFTWPLYRFSKDGQPSLFPRFEQTAAYYVLDVVAARLKEEISENLAGKEAISDEARDVQLAQIDAEIARLELQEETLIRQAERAGLVAPRRANASAAALLAPDDIPDEELSEEDKAYMAEFEKRHKRGAVASDDGAGHVFQMA